MQAKTNNTTTMRGREAEEWVARYLEANVQREVARNFRIRVWRST
jgi:Holliday junction resolvase-like predicted endonuclease